MFSLTTVDTPHHGSYNAALRTVVAAANKDPSIFLTLEEYAINKLAPNSRMTEDLTPDQVEFFNKTSKDLPKSTVVNGRKNTTFYFSVSADANLDDSCQGLAPGSPCDPNHLPTITAYPGRPDESEGYEYPAPEIAWYNVLNVGQKLYRQMYSFRNAGLVISGYTTDLKPVRRIVSVPTTPQLNDFNVTVTSARYPGFVEIGSFKHNHTMVGLQDVSTAILNVIKNKQKFE